MREFSTDQNIDS